MQSTGRRRAWSSATQGQRLALAPSTTAKIILELDVDTIDFSDKTWKRVKTARHMIPWYLSGLHSPL